MAFDKDIKPIMLPPPAFDGDMLHGCDEIAAYIGKTKRQVHWLLERKRLPAFQIGRNWQMRKSTYDAVIQQREAEAIAKLSLT